MTGRNINDYTIGKILGEGGMATVYLALNNKFKTDVAIKVLNKEFVYNANIRKRFLAEARNMFRMNHPNVIKVTDLIEEEDMVAFVMEYVEGDTLKDWLVSKGELSDIEIKSLFSQMLDAVAYVHEQGIIHRDIKPSNFIINKKGKVRLLDFGISKNSDINSGEYTMTSTSQNMGTPMYMSPEQIKNPSKVVAQSDIYSLGVVLWQLVTGKKPYDAATKSTFDIQSQIVNDPLPSTQTIWDPIIQKATQKNISHRYSDIASIQASIEKRLWNKESDRPKQANGESTVFEKQDSYSKTSNQSFDRKPSRNNGKYFLIGVILIIGVGLTLLLLTRKGNTGTVKEITSANSTNKNADKAEPRNIAPPQDNTVSGLTGTEESNIKIVIRNFYDTENSGDANRLMSFYQFPLVRYYQYKGKTYDQLYYEVVKAFQTYLFYHSMQIDWSSFISERKPGGYRCKFNAVYGSGSKGANPKYQNQVLGIELNESYKITSVYKIS